jgi:uracil-DNA glycosylase
MKLKRKSSDWTSSFSAVLTQRGGINRLQGHPEASIFLIAPVPRELEASHNLAWCDKSASRFFMWMQNEIGLKSNEDFLIMPCTFDGKKPVKANTDVGHEIVAAAAASDHIERFVCVGSDAFKTYFGYGMKPSMHSLAGHTMYSLQQARFKPVFVFPDLHALNFEDDKQLFPMIRDYFKARYLCKTYMGVLDKMKGPFEQFLKARRQ